MQSESYVSLHWAGSTEACWTLPGAASLFPQQQLSLLLPHDHYLEPPQNCAALTVQKGLELQFGAFFFFI